MNEPVGQTFVSLSLLAVLQDLGRRGVEADGIEVLTS